MDLSTGQTRTIAALTLSLAGLAGCASSRPDLEARDYWPRKQRWKQAVVNAVTDGGTWIPLAGAGVVSIDGWDGKISEWAVENTPVFGSAERALEASDTLRTSTTIAMVGTALAVPNGDGAWQSRWERLALEVLGVQLNNVLTGGLKSLTNRERPDGSDDRSFPSGHASQAFNRATFAIKNLEDNPKISSGWEVALGTSFRVLAAGTAWARVEGGVHYPSDVLFGAALGNFVAVFVHDAFLPSDATFDFSATLSRSEVQISFSFRF